MHRIAWLCVLACFATAAATVDARSQVGRRLLVSPSAAPAGAAAAACVQEVEPNGDWTTATQGPGIGSSFGSASSFCVWGELSGAHDKDVFSTWLGFPFAVSEWGTLLHVFGSDLIRVTVYQRVPHGWLRIVQKAGMGEIHLDEGEVFFEHYPQVTPPYLYITVEGRPQTYRMDNFVHAPAPR